VAENINAELILEAAEQNPFLPAFYDDPENAALPAQLHFLFQRIRQAGSLQQTDLFNTTQVADFLIEKDNLFAKATLGNAEYELYRQVYDRLAPRTPVPDLVIYLQAAPEFLLKRILKRGITYEKNINEAYLKKISDAYVDFFYHYDQSPLLIINTENFDLTDGDDNFNLLVEHIGKLTAGKHYFNPRGL
jgi:deoxyadenosine/deoxycytidine kinase